MIRTFLDPGVLIAATRVATQDAGDALALLTDPGRIFITSPFVFLEVVPKAIYFGMQFEREVYDRYFENAQWYRDLEKIEATARREAIRTDRRIRVSIEVALDFCNPRCRSRTRPPQRRDQGKLCVVLSD